MLIWARPERRLRHQAVATGRGFHPTGQRRLGRLSPIRGWNWIGKRQHYGRNCFRVGVNYQFAVRSSQSIEGRKSLPARWCSMIFLLSRWLFLFWLLPTTRVQQWPVLTAERACIDRAAKSAKWPIEDTALRLECAQAWPTMSALERKADIPLSLGHFRV